MTLWSGRVQDGLAPEVWEFLKADDSELLPYDCAATLVHAQRLYEAGLLSKEELAEVQTALERIAAEGTIDAEDEDVHSAIERLLGEVGKKIHAGRSRNDQVAAAFRLYVANAFAAVQAAPSPLGSGALAGSTLPLPPPPNAMRNSLDAVADRDFALDYLYAVAVLFTHLSRIGEELVLWTSAEFAFAKLPEFAATGSSMMPQKLNPDVAELARGKAGTAIGRLTGLLATIKGLPLAYDRDLQEDKPPVFAARRDVAGALGALGVLVDGLKFDRERLAAASSDPLLLATDAAEALVREGVPFREAHEQVAASVREGTFVPPAPAPRLPDVTNAIEEARERWAR